MPVLIEQRPDGSLRQEWPIVHSKKYIIGRNPDASSIVISHPTLSRTHATITLNTSNTFTITDMNAVNGTFLNDVRLVEPMEVSLKTSPVIRFAQCPYTYVIQCDSVFEKSSEDPVPGKKVRRASPTDKGLERGKEKNEHKCEKAEEQTKSDSRRKSGWDKPQHISDDLYKKRNIQEKKMSIDEKKKLLWGRKPSQKNPAKFREVEEETPYNPISSVVSKNSSMEDPNMYRLSFNADEQKKQKFLKLMGYKGKGENEAPPPHIADSEKVATQLEIQYHSGLKQHVKPRGGLGT